MPSILVKQSVLTTVSGQSRVVIEAVTPEVDGGRFPIKRVVDEAVTVEADIFADGHDVLSAVVKWRSGQSSTWSESPMELLVNDRWRGTFELAEVGSYQYTIEGWINHFRSWRRDLEKKSRAGQDLSSELIAGAELIQQTMERARGGDATDLKTAVQTLLAKT